MLKSLGFIAVLFAVTCFAWDIDPVRPAAAGSSTPVLRDTTLEIAMAHYAEFCAGCHGIKMNAFLDRRWKHGNSREDLFKAIKFGYADEGMPAYDTAFTDEEIYRLSDYMLNNIAALERYNFNDLPQKANRFESEDLTVRLDTIVQGINIAWGLAFLPGGDLLFTEKSGGIYRVKKNKKQEKISGVPEVLDEGQGGLMDIKLHPDFKKNKVLYISYAKPKKEDGKTLSTTAIMRAVLKGNALTDQKVIFEALPYATTRFHYGGRMEFDRQGYLYFSVGDRGNHNRNPQYLDNHCGKIHRVNDDGSVPADNPFVNTPGAMSTIWSYGHRNPQGIAIDPATGVLWTNEHGPRGGDEMNIVRKGKNYGWPVISYGINYNGTTFTNETAREGMEQPELYWVPSIAPSGLAFVQGDRYKNWKGDALVSSLRYDFLDRCKMENGKIAGEESLLKGVGRLRDVRMAPDGYIYISVERPGFVFRLMPVVD